MRFGLCSDYPWPHGLDHARRFIGDTTRFILYWPGINPVGTDDWNLTWYDKVIATMALNGQRSIVCLGAQDPRSYTEYFRLVEVVAEAWRSNPNVVALELWNEPNLQRFGPIPASEMAWRVRHAYELAHSVGWQKPILAPGPSPVGGWEQYLKDMIASGIPRGAGFALHPYPRKDEIPEDSVDRQIRTYKSIVGLRGLWITEVGRSTGDVSEERQAKQLSRIVDVAQAHEPRVKACMIFRAADPLQAPNPWEGGLGLHWKDWSAKRAYRTLKRWWRDR